MVRTAAIYDRPRKTKINFYTPGTSRKKNFTSIYLYIFYDQLQVYYLLYSALCLARVRRGLLFAFLDSEQNALVSVIDCIAIIIRNLFF